MAKRNGWQTIDNTKFGVPSNAKFGRWTGYYGMMGGPVWEYADEEGRGLGETSFVPPNLNGESTKDAGHRRPGEVIIPELTLRKLRLLAKYPGSYAANDGYHFEVVAKKPLSTEDLAEQEAIRDLEDPGVAAMYRRWAHI
ncbi:MAG: hypothetical protein AAB597_02815 [Patescibacteria group bacterium]